MSDADTADGDDGPEMVQINLRTIIAVRGVRVGHTQALYHRIYKSVVRIRFGRHLQY